MKSLSVVVDSNLAIFTVIDSEFSVSTSQVWSKLLSSKASIYAPELWNYETTSIIRKYCALEWITDAEAEEALIILDQLQIQFLVPDLKLCQAARHWASRLHQKAAYDGFYLATAEQLGAEFWTADKKLANNANLIGANWVHWTGEME